MDFTQIIPQFGNFFFTMGAFIVALSVIVAIHEYGHYIVGRWCGIHAEVFSLGFGPVLYTRVDKRGTSWQVAALPFGGFVKFLGDADIASVGTSEVSAADIRRTMTGAPLWARSLTVLAGPVFNFVFSLLIFAGIMLSEGRAVDPLTFDFSQPLPADYVMELQQGDVILAVNGQESPALTGFADFVDTLPMEPVLEYTVLRGGLETNVSGPFPFPAKIIRLSPRSEAMDAGLRVGDVVTQIDGRSIFAFSQLQTAVKEAGGAPVLLQVWREGAVLEFDLTARREDLPSREGGYETRWLLGISGGLFFEAATVPVGPIDALSNGARQVWFVITSSLNALGNIIVGNISTCNLSGPVGIAQVSGDMAAQGAGRFIWFIAFLSTAVGLLNLFPIPVLDGGHLVFHAYEAITGKPPGNNALHILMVLGLTVVLGFTLFAVLNDLFLCP